MKKLVLVLILILMIAAFTACSESDTGTYDAKVISVSGEMYTEQGRTYSIQNLAVELLEGPDKGKPYEAQVYMDITNYTDIALYRAGDTVEVTVYTGEDGSVEYVNVVNLVRTPYIIILAAVFLLLIGVIGRLKGLKTILALVFTVSAVIFALVPLISNGYDPVLSAALVCIAVSVVTLFTVGGFNKKSLSAVLGTIGGLVCAGGITLVFSALIRVTGIDTSEADLLMASGSSVGFNYQGILTAGILIGCIGAVMDVGMSISSSINEMHTINPALPRKKLFSSGIAVGRDIIGTMANTLILAYTGGSLMLMVVWSVYGISFADMLNKNFIVLEIAKSLCGSIGMVATIPLTAYIASFFVRLENSKNQEDEDIKEGA
jgi:uncharacterized membrane protein